MTYKVGQVIYIIFNKSTHIIPALVVEKLTTQSLKEVSERHSIILPEKYQKNFDKKLYVEIVDGSIFLSIDDAKQTLLKNAVNVIDGIVNEAAQLAKATFGEFIKDQQKNDNVDIKILENANDKNQSLNLQEANISVDDVEIMLPDGRKALAKARIQQNK